MNYQSLTMDELTGFLCNELDRDKFIDAAKELTRRIINGDFMSKMDHDAAMEIHWEEAIDKGIEAARNDCREEAQGIVDMVSSQLDKETLEFLNKNMATIG